MSEQQFKDALESANRGPHDDTDVALIWAGKRIAELEAENEVLLEVAFYLYCNGYEKGHNDTVESCYAPPAEHPEEFPEIMEDALLDGTK